MAERKNSEKRIASNNKWTNAHYDRVNLAIPKGRKELIKAHAEAHSESVNGFINRAIDRVMAQDTAETTPEAAGGPQGAGGVSLSSETIKAAQQAAEATGETVPVFIDRAIEETADRDALSRRMEGGENHVGKGTFEPD